MACASSRTRAALLALCGVSAGVVAGPSAAAESPVSIELRPLVKVEQANVRLGDIAYLTATDLPTMRRLMALPIGTAPRPGSPAVLDRDTIVQWVEARSGMRAVERDAALQPAIRWSGSSETTIEAAAQELSGETVADAARSALLNWLSQRSVRAEVQPVSTVRDLVLPAGTPTLRVRPVSSAGPSRRMLVWVDVWVDNRFVRTMAVTFEVEAWAPVTVATSGMGSGATVDGVSLRGATTTREVDLTKIPHGTPLLAAADGKPETASADQRLRRPLKAGEVLTTSHLEATPAVVRGNWAHLLARSGDVSVESRVEVLQDGREGQVVRVKVPGSGGEVLARVTGPGQVEVQP